MPVLLYLAAPVVDEPNEEQPHVPDLDPSLPVCFAGQEAAWREAMPFAPWRLYPDGEGVEQSCLSLFYLERLLTPYINFSELEDMWVVDCDTPGPDFYARLFKGLRSHFEVVSAIYDSEHDFLQKLADFHDVREARCAKFLLIEHGEMLELEPETRPYDAKARWVHHTPWCTSKGLFNEDGKFMGGSAGIACMLGPRAHANRTNPASLSASVATIFHDAFSQKASNITLAPEAMAGQIVKWFAGFRWPVELLQSVAENSDLAGEALLFTSYENGSRAERSELLDREFHRVMALLPTVRELCRGTFTKKARPVLSLLLDPLGIEQPPLLEQWLQLNSVLRTGGYLSATEDIPSGNKALQAKVYAIISEVNAEKKTKAVKASGASSKVLEVGGLVATDGIYDDASSDSFNSLRKDPALKSLVRKLDQYTPGENKLEVLQLLLKSRLCGVVRWACGALKTLDAVDPIFSAHDASKMMSFTSDSFDRLGVVLGHAVTRSEWEKKPRLKAYKLANSTVLHLLLGKWSEIDFEQLLVLNVDRCRAGEELSATDMAFARPAAQRMTNLSHTERLVAPLCALMEAIGYTGQALADTKNSVAAVAAKLVKSHRLAEANLVGNATVLSRTQEFALAAIKEAGEAWELFFCTQSAFAPFPTSWLPSESSCHERLDSAIKSANTMGDWAADLPEVMDKILKGEGTRKALKDTPTGETLPSPLSNESALCHSKQLCSWGFHPVC